MNKKSLGPRWRCKTHLFYPKNLLEELSGMSSYPELIPEEFFTPYEIRKKFKNPNFWDEFLSGSSHLGGLICSEIESLNVLKVFCTIFQHHTSITDVFWMYWILVIFQHSKVDFRIFGFRNLSLGTILGTICNVFSKHMYQTLFTTIYRRSYA